MVIFSGCALSGARFSNELLFGNKFCDQLLQFCAAGWRDRQVLNALEHGGRFGKFMPQHRPQELLILLPPCDEFARKQIMRLQTPAVTPPVRACERESPLRPTVR